MKVGEAIGGKIDIAVTFYVDAEEHFGGQLVHDCLAVCTNGLFTTFSEGIRGLGKGIEYNAQQNGYKG